MQTAEKKKKYTIADYMLLEEGAPFQLVENELIMSPSPNTLHQALVFRIARFMLNYLDENDIDGYAGGTIDVVLDENNVFQPDVAYVSPERKAEIVKDRIYGAPDLVIEILSPSNYRFDQNQKKELYERYGVKEYIIFNPTEASGVLYILNDGVFQIIQKASKSGKLKSEVIPGFNFDLSKLFK